MKIIRVEQGSVEWDKCRRGRITASMMDCVFAGPETKAYQGAMHAISCDVRGIEPLEGGEDYPWFDAGHEHEAAALMAYELRHNVDTWRDAFLVHDEYEWLGCSPDFLIGPETAPTAGGEIKCRKYVASYMRAIHAPENRYQRLPRGYFLQIQCALLISGFKEWTLVNYYIGGQNAKPREADRQIYRDEEIIDQILEKSADFYMKATKP